MQELNFHFLHLESLVSKQNFQHHFKVQETTIMQRLVWVPLILIAFNCAGHHIQLTRHRRERSTTVCKSFQAKKKQDACCATVSSLTLERQTAVLSYCLHYLLNSTQMV